MTPQNLQEHMLRVASLSKIITDNWTGETLDNLAIVKACAMHDIAKPVNFDTSQETQKKYNMDPKDRANLEKLKKYIKDNFGTDEHRAATEMCKHMELGPVAVEIVDNMEWSYLPALLEKNNSSTLIAVYCDMRIGPKGILSLRGRFDDSRARAKGIYEDYYEDAKKCEELIQKNTNIDINIITDQDLNSLFPEILNIEI